VDFHEGPSGRKGFICNWGDRYTVANGLLGINKATTILGLITVNAPMAWPENALMYCHSVEFEPKGPPTQGAKQLQWQKVIVWANYKCTPWNFSGIDDPTGQNEFPNANYIYAEQQMNSSVEILTVPGRATRFRSNPNHTTGTDAGFRLSLVEIIITYHRVPYLPSAQAFQLAGAINNQPFLGVNTGQLMFNGYQTHQTRNTDGTVTTDVTAGFTARSLRWDYGFDPVAGAFDQIVMPDNVTPFIQAQDLSQTVPLGFG
jgi:hypothetical protein